MSNTPAVTNNRKQEFERKARKVRAVRLIQRIWRGHQSRKALRQFLAILIDIQARAQGFVARQALFQPTPMFIKDEHHDDFPSLSAIPEHEEHQNQNTQRTRPSAKPLPPRDQFWADFNEYNEIVGTKPGMPWVQIGSHSIDFWDLWRSATTDEEDEEEFEDSPSSRDWEVVCERLGLDWVEEPGVVGKVRGAFERWFGDFEAALRGFEEEAEEEEEEEEEEGGKDEEEQDEIDRENDQEHDEAEDDSNSSQVYETAPTGMPGFESSPPVLGRKRMFNEIRGSSVSLGSSVNKRRRYDPSSEIPFTPEKPSPQARQNGTSPMAEKVDETPTRRLQASLARRQKAPVEPGTQHSQSDLLPRRRNGLLVLESRNSQFNGAEDEEDEEDLQNPSQQLLSEVDVRSPSLATREVVGLRSSPNRQLPSVERNEMTESSDGFGTPMQAPPRLDRHVAAREPLSASDTNRPHRALPASWSKGRQPASSDNLSPLPSRPPAPPRPGVSWTPNRPPQPSTAPLNQPQPNLSATRPPPSIPPTNTSFTHREPKPFPQPLSRPWPLTQSCHPSPTPSSTAHPPRAIIDPTPLIIYYTSLGHPQPAVVRAIKATNFRETNADIVLRSLAQGRGIPEDIAGVWTDEDDVWVRGLGAWLDCLTKTRERERGMGMGMGMPEREDKGWFGGDERSWRRFWELVGRHGLEEVLERRKALRAWDMV